ncbi:formate dehydrogenase accessory sulfurtransferase FdhD, partial [Verrucomicrobiales bacterium]|nr:formate dehydrogenase accessory sulfurtransferase FdhD [Verrucomicrobiales bacterium]
MSDVSTFDAALIGGGRSRRFGDDKAFLEWRGQPLYQRQLDTLRELEPNRLWLSTNSDQDFPSIEGIERVIDEQSDLGPIGGLLSVFRKSEADQILVLGVDLPLMTSDFLRHLVEQGSGTIAKSERFWEPLVGFYKRLETLQLLETAVAETDLKLQALLNRAESKGIARALPFEESEKILFTNLNTPHDLSAIDPNRFDDTISLKRFHRSSGLAEADDFVAAEEPLEVRVNGQSVSVMMRTPGHDEELATGFLFTESVIQSAADIREIKHLDDVDRSSSGNTLEIELESEPDLTDLTRHVFTSSSCGVCGKATIDSVFQQFPPIQEAKSVSPDLILALPDRLRAAQKTFDRTGGLHASALFSREGK